MCVIMFVRRVCACVYPQTDLFAQFRTQDTSIVDSVVGTCKRSIFSWMSRNQAVRLDGSADTLRRDWQSKSC